MDDVPPNRNVVRNPIANIIDEFSVNDPRHMVPIQLKNFTPVGTAIMNVMNEKKGRFTAPVTNMWCAHTDTDSAPMDSVANTRP